MAAPTHPSTQKRPWHRWLWRGLGYLLLLVLILDIIGVALTAYRPTIEWEATATTGFPSSPSQVILTLIEYNNSLYAGTFGGGIFRSDDNGAHWVAANEGLSNHMISTLLKQSNILYAGTLGSGVFRSNDGGSVWFPVNEGLSNPDVRSLIAEGRTLYAGTFGDGVFRSDDEGSTWFPVSNGLSNLEVQTLIVLDNNLFANTTDGNVFYSNNGGQLWTRMSDDFPNPNIRSLISYSHILFMGGQGDGVFRSDNGGLYWVPINNGLTNLDIRALLIQNETLFVATRGGVFRSDNGGLRWIPVNNGINDLNVNTLLIHDHLLFAGTSSSGIFSSDDGGFLWVPVNNGLNNLVVRTLLVQDTAFYAGTFNGGVFRSSDNGRLWTPINNGLGDLNVQALTAQEKLLFAGTFGNGIFRTEIGDFSWVPINDGLGNLDILALVTNNNDLLLAGTRGGGIYRSTDNGSRWIAMNNGLSSFIIQALAIQNDIFFAGTFDDGVFRFDDQDSIWIPINQGLTNLNIQALIAQDDMLYAGTRNGVFRFDGQGSIWIPVNQGLSNLDVQALIAQDNIILATTSNSGIFRFDERTSSWFPINNGLNNLEIQTLMAQGNSLFSTITGGGVFRSEDNGNSWEPVPEVKSEILAETRHSSEFQMTAQNNKVELTLSGLLPIPWINYTSHAPSTYQYQPRGRKIIVYALAGASMRLKAETTLPFIWDLPRPYIALLGATWQGIYWFQNHSIQSFSFVILTTILTLVLFYTTLARPNQFHLKTSIWLLSHPRNLRSALSYQLYHQQWEQGSPLVKLLPLISAESNTFTLEIVQTQLRKLGVAFDEASLETALFTWIHSGFLQRIDKAWQWNKPSLIQIQSYQLPNTAKANLAYKTRQIHPRYKQARRYLHYADFDITAQAPFCYLANSNNPLWQDITPLYIQILLNQPLNMKTFQALLTNAREVFGDSLQNKIALAFIDQQPAAGDLHQIFALRAQEQFTIIPVPSSLLTQGERDRQQMELLRSQINLYLGREDLYNQRTAVSDVLSFFGRQSLLAELKRQLKAGQSLSLFGLRKIGKSSLISRLREECDWPLALIDVEGFIGGLNYICQEALDNWRAAIQQQYPQLALPESLLVPLPTQSAIQAQAFRHVVGDLLARLAELPSAPGLLLCLDEMDELFEQPDFRAFAALLRSLAETGAGQSRFALLIAGLDPRPTRTDRLHNGRNPFYAFFTEQPLGTLEPEDTRSMIIALGGQMGVGYTNEALTMLIELGGGHPFLTRQLCSLATQGEEQRPLTLDDTQIADTITTYLRQPDNYFAESLWGIDQGGPPAKEAEMLRQLAHQQPLAEAVLIPNDLPPAEQRRKRQALAQLLDQSLIVAEASGYVVTIPLYRRWIQEHVLL